MNEELTPARLANLEARDIAVTKIRQTLASEYLLCSGSLEDIYETIRKLAKTCSMKPLHKTTPEEPPITRPATAESYTSVEEPSKSYKEAFNKSERKAIEILRQESTSFDKLVIEEMAKTSANEKKAASDKVGTGLVLIPLYSLLNLGKIFIEGLRYGRDSWKKGVNDKEYQEERLEHAILHLIKYKEGDRSEEHLAKVSWFCFTQLELERLERETK